MNVVGHQCIGMDAATNLASVLGQPFKIEAVILVREEASLAVVSALDQVEGNARQSKARAARYGDGPSENGWPKTIRKPWSVPYYLRRGMGCSVRERVIKGYQKTVVCPLLLIRPILTIIRRKKATPKGGFYFPTSCRH
jgi:hypothetical protein